MSRVGYLKVLAATYKRDLKGMGILYRVQKGMKEDEKKNMSATLKFSEKASKNPSKVAFMCEDRKYTNQDIDQFSNQVANFFTHQGLKKGDDVALFMHSSPEYVGLWLGLAKAGIVTALINNNLKLDTLAHSISIVNSKAVIFDYDHRHVIAAVMPLLKASKIKYFMFGSGDDIPEGAHSMSSDLSSEPKNFKLVPVNFSDKLLYVYTSGTTGFPKAVIMKHSRYLLAGHGINNILSVTNNDVLYTPLPLHHFAGGIMGTSQVILMGASMAIRSKASVSNYFVDCKKYNATIGQYVGELCRYLHAQPEKTSDKEHNIRVMFGNGIRSNLWESFRSRFNIPQIVEVYGTSEGNAQIINLDNKAGSCGFMSLAIPNFLSKKIYPVSLIKCNPETGEPIRDSKGFCIPCKPGEVGQFVGKIDQSNPIRAFDGYSSDEATKKKIIKDVFAKGETAFASGDLLYMDDYGYLYFHDRTGDTFRWKGENVSTTQVESVIMKEAGLADVVVYGVTIPGCEGRAGMATIQATSKSLDVDDLMEKMSRVLPDYAIPVFLRISDQIEQTATFKLTKTTLQKESFDPSQVKEPLFYLDPKSKKYQKLTQQTYHDITSGKISF